MKKSKILIVYGTKTGTTEECTNILYKKIKGDIDVINLRDKHDFDLDNYDYIIIGTPIYAGMINTRVKNFCFIYEDILVHKKLAFFTCGLSKPEEALASLSKAISPKLISQAKVVGHFGGELRPDKLKFFMKFVVKQMTKNKTIESKLNKTAIEEFCQKISGK